MLSSEIQSVFPEVGTKIKIVVGGESMDATISHGGNRRKIRSVKLFRILKPKMGDVLSITKRNHDTYEMSLKHR